MSLGSSLQSAASCTLTIVILVALPTTHGCAQQQRPGPAALTLRVFLDSVRALHPTLLAASSRVRAAEGGRASAGAFGNPIIGYQVDQTPFPGGHPLVGMEREAMTTATLPLEFLYQRKPRVDRANAEVRAAAAEAVVTRQRLGLDAAAAFYRTGLAQVQASVTHDLLDWLDTLVAYNRARAEEGVAAEADLIRSEVERDRVGAEAAMQDAELVQARAALGAFLPSGRFSDVGPRVVLDGAPMPLPASRALSADTVAAPRGLEVRPEVRAARERLAASNADIASERSMLIRQLGATIGTMRTGHKSSMIAGLSLPFPLVDQNRGAIQHASAERDAAAFELAAQERMAEADLRGAQESVRILTERASRLASRDSSGFLARADESRRIALGAYREGAVPLFQVIDAARSWSEARTTYYRTIVTQHQSVLLLLVAQGRDLFLEATLPAATGGTFR